MIPNLTYEVYACLECGAELPEGSAKQHFDTQHRGANGAPLWEHGATEKQPAQGSD